MVWKLLFVKVRTVLTFPDSQLSYEERKKSFYAEMVEKIVFEVNQSRLAFVTVTKL